MTRYFLSNKPALAETLSRALDFGITDIRITDCSGDAVGYYIDMDLACVLTEHQEMYVTYFTETLELTT